MGRHDVGGRELDWAHAPQDGGVIQEPHGLDEHLLAVGDGAAMRVREAISRLTWLAGVWHDLGKRRPGFQRYIRSASGAQAHVEGRVADRDKTHSAAGALWAWQWLGAQQGMQGRLLARVLQYAIAGHHAGLDNWDGGNSPGLAARLASDDAQCELTEAIHALQSEGLLKPSCEEVTPAAIKALAIANERTSQEPGRFALHVRMLFSALVDADFIDTESYFDVAKTQGRKGFPDLQPLQVALHAHMGGMSRSDSHVNRVRAEVLAQCRVKAALPPGVFSLAVPTGGGKTLSSLAFALDHAAAHGMRRVIYAIPYTSIIEQTADVFRAVFASLGDEVVVEHHSNAEADPAKETARSRLACENWDAPLVVSTNVQLFESLFARKTSRCRKLHNLARSVIVLDEAQLLSVGFLQPIVDVLRYLVQDFGVTVLLCTATQPALNMPPSADPQRGLQRGIGPVTAIIDHPEQLYANLERVRVQLPESFEAPRAWSDLADDMLAHDALLAIVNRRADASELYQLMRQRAPNDPCWHLSALMCAQHRSDAIAEIKAALQERRDALAAGHPAQAVRIAATQLVECGVDLDLPVVYRALAGLDAIAQAAGRCNREGRLTEPGVVHVFVPPTKSPPGLLTLARDTCKLVWADRPSNPFDLALIDRYFQRLYHDHPTDEKRICELLRLIPNASDVSLPVQFRDASDAFKLIDEKDAATVLVRYRSPKAKEDIDTLIGLLQRDGPQRWLMRKLQRYTVTLYRHQLAQLRDIEEVASCPGLYVQREGCDTFYHPVLGARVDGAPGDPSAYAI